MGRLVSAALDAGARRILLTPAALILMIGAIAVTLVIWTNLTLSPDGSQVAFTWNGPNEDNFDIYVQLVGPGERRARHRSTGRDPRDRAYRLEGWHALQSWLEGTERRVKIPYAKRLAGSIPPVAVRLRRDFGEGERGGLPAGR